VSVEAGALPDGADSLAWVRVEDNGPGIAPDHLPHLFDRFYRVDKARSHNASDEDQVQETESQPGGSGLGLSIVQWVARAHGGRVQVASRLGYGSTFEVLLPANRASTN
jgi:signal transduction histidine kinase